MHRGLHNISLLEAIEQVPACTSVSSTTHSVSPDQELHFGRQNHPSPHKPCCLSCWVMMSPLLAHSLWTSATTGEEGQHGLTACKQLGNIKACFWFLSVVHPLLATLIGLGGGNPSKQWAEHLCPVYPVLLTTVCPGLCWLRSAITETSLKRLRMGTPPNAFLYHNVDNHIGICR